MIKFERLPDNISARIAGVKTLLAKEPGVLFAYLFGGLARNRATPLSDIDIAVYLKNKHIRPTQKLKLFSKITDVLGTNELDLVILNNAADSLAGRILQNKQLLADKRPFLRHRYESVTLRKYFDFRIREDRILKARFGIGR